MAIPFILGGMAIAAAVTGVSKGLDAKDKNEKAQRIIRRVKRDFNDKKSELEEQGHILNENLENFSKLKLDIWTTQIGILVELIKRCKKLNAKLEHENLSFTPEEVEKLEKMVHTSLEISSGIGKGLQSGVLTAFGAYGGVGMLASASTGTAISTLSGAAATNATLAWLGGGSLAAGGGGMALGTAVLGGIVAGPLIAVTGLVMNSKAEENLTEAYEYESETRKQIEKMDTSIEEINITNERINELTHIIQELTIRFDNIAYKINNVNVIEKIKRYFDKSKFCELQELENLLLLGKNLKQALEISLLDEEGNNNSNFKKELQRIEL